MTVELAYTEQGEGDGEALVIAHGLFGSATNWRSLARRLADGRRVYAVDLRNHGRSPHTDTMDYPAMAADVLAFLDARGLERPALLGHSMGGKAVMQVALEHPARVSRLVVADIAPVRYEHEFEDLIGAMRGVDLARVERRSDADRQLAGAVDDAGLRTFLLQNLESTEGGFRWRIHLDGIEGSLDELLGFPAADGDRVYAGPTLFVRGERSRYVRDDDAPLIRERFPEARIETVADAGHWLHAENPQGFLEIVAPFLA